MVEAQGIRRVPWTCRWGRFGGPVPSLDAAAPGFVFWMCGHPDERQLRALERGSCVQCPKWEAPDNPDA